MRDNPVISRDYYEHNGRKIWYPKVRHPAVTISYDGCRYAHVSFIKLMEMMVDFLIMQAIYVKHSLWIYCLVDILLNIIRAKCI